MKKAVKTVGFMVIATLLAKIMGMLRDIFIAGCYGTNAQATAFSYASSIPVLFFDLTLGTAILSTFIPVFNEYLSKDDKERAMEFANTFISFALLISSVFTIIGMIFSGAFTNLIASGLPESVESLTSHLLIILMPTTILTTLAYCFVGILQSYGEFNIPAIISLVSNCAIVIYLIFLNKYFGIYGLAVAMLLGWGLQSIVQIPKIKKFGFKFRFNFNFKNSGIIQVFKLSLPVLVSSWVQPVTVLINKRFASYISSGSAGVALDYANRLYLIVVSVFAFGITNYIFPSMSKLSGNIENGELSDEFGETLRQSVRALAIIIIPVMVGAIILSNEIITLVYQRGEFSKESVELTACALKYYSIGMIFYGINEIINKCFFALKDGKTPMIASIIGIFTATILSFSFTEFFDFGILGLALSGAISVFVVFIILTVKMQKKYAKVFDKVTVTNLIKVIISALFMGVAVYIIRNSFGNIYIKTAISVVGGGIVYFVLLFLLKNDDILSFLKKEKNNGIN